MRKDTTSTIKRAERFQIILIGEGILVGGIGGLVVLLYRMCLEYAGKWLNARVFPGFFAKNGLDA